MAEELTRQEKILVQILIQCIEAETSEEYRTKIVRRAGLTKHQAKEAMEWPSVED